MAAPSPPRTPRPTGQERTVEQAADARSGDSARSDRAALLSFLGELLSAPPDAATADLAAELLGLPGDAPWNLGERYTRMFELNVYPYASVFLDPSGMLGGDRRALIGGALAALGFQPGAPGSADDDHLATLLQALAALTDREVTAADAAGRERARHAQGVLLAEHILPWMPSFTHAVERVGDPFYEAVCRALREALADACDDLALEAASPFAMAAPPSTGDDNDTSRGGAEAPETSHGNAPGAQTARASRKRPAPDGRRHLEMLLSPARSGLYLSRHDVQRIGRAIGMPVRRGERAFMLQALLEAAGEEARVSAPAALAEAALVQSRRIGAWQDAHPRLSRLWDAWKKRIDETHGALAELST